MKTSVLSQKGGRQAAIIEEILSLWEKNIRKGLKKQGKIRTDI